jgi:integrase
MMKKTPKNKSFVYVNEYVRRTIVVVNKMDKNYTTPELFIPKDKNGKPTVAKGKYWYVWFYFKNPINNEFNWNEPIIIKKGINRLKTVSDRRAFGKEMIAELLQFLSEGWSPYENVNTEFNNTKKRLTIVEALNYAIDHKKNEVKQSTIDDYIDRKNNFVKWLISKQLQRVYLDEINKRHISSFLNHLSSTTSNRNVNNYKTALSALYTKLVEDDFLKTNFILSMKKRATKPTMHKSFSKSELYSLKHYLIKNDKYLYYFMCFVAYSFLRNREVTRLKVKDINTTEWYLTIETKTDKKEIVPIVKPLQEILVNFNLHNYDSNCNLFTPEGKPGLWITKKESYKVDYFSKRFKKPKKYLGFDLENTIYSLRHTFAIDLYNHFISQGLTERETILKMLPITRHKNESGLRNYLRSVNAFKVDDYSDKFSIDF